MPRLIAVCACWQAATIVLVPLFPSRTRGDDARASEAAPLDDDFDGDGARDDDEPLDAARARRSKPALASV